MPFGLKNSGETFQRHIYSALGDLKHVFVYIDDILIASNSRKEHEDHIREVCERLKKYGLRINSSECQFGKTEKEFLGYLITSQGIKPMPEKIKAITEYPKPITRDELCRWLSMENFLPP